MKIVIINWVDSCGSTHWVEKKHFSPEIIKCESVGIVIAETDDHITITTTQTNDDSNYHEPQNLSPVTIPKCAITDIWELEIE